MCAILGQKYPFFAQNSPQTRAKRPNEEKRWLHETQAKGNGRYTTRAA